MSRTKTPPAGIDAGIRLMRLAAERDQLDAQLEAAVLDVLAAGGSWTTVGVALGVSRQAAQQRFGRVVQR